MTKDDSGNVRAVVTHRAGPFLNTAQAAHYLCIATRTLEEMRKHGEGPPFRKHGRLVFYHIADIDAWSLANTRNSSMCAPAQGTS